MYSAMILSGVSLRLRLMRSLRTDMIDFELEAETQREREGESCEREEGLVGCLNRKRRRHLQIK